MTCKLIRRKCTISTDNQNELKEEMLKLQEQYNDPVRFSPERDKE